MIFAHFLTNLWFFQKKHFLQNNQKTLQTRFKQRILYITFIVKVGISHWILSTQSPESTFKKSKICRTLTICRRNSAIFALRTKWYWSSPCKNDFSRWNSGHQVIFHHVKFTKVPAPNFYSENSVIRQVQNEVRQVLILVREILVNRILFADLNLVRQLTFSPNCSPTYPDPKIDTFSKNSRNFEIYYNG